MTLGDYSFIANLITTKITINNSHIKYNESSIDTINI